MSDRQPVRLADGWWLMLICFERKVLLADCWWLVRSEKKYCWLVMNMVRPQAVFNCWRVNSESLTQIAETSSLFQTPLAWIELIGF
jgi:hypothetical protein